MDEDRLESFILHRLCEAGPLTESELEREFPEGDVEDCLAMLRGRGLVNDLGGDYLIASAAGRHAHDLDPSWP